MTRSPSTRRVLDAQDRVGAGRERGAGGDADRRPGVSGAGATSPAATSPAIRSGAGGAVSAARTA